MSAREVSFPFINPPRMHPRVISGYVKPSYPRDIIRITLFMLSLSERFFDEDDATDDDYKDGRETNRQAGRGRKRERKDAKKTKRNHDGAFAGLTKQFKRLSCPFNALKRLAEGRIAITETPSLSSPSRIKRQR